MGAFTSTPVEITLGAVLTYAVWDLIKDWHPAWPWSIRDPVVAVDRAPGGSATPAIARIAAVPTFVSARYRLRGRPDELRRAPDGRLVPVEITYDGSARSGGSARIEELRPWGERGLLVPVEIKSHLPPIGLPYRSHRIQVLAYCLLIEETFGVPPPHGVLVYGDGSEVRVPWDSSSRDEVLEVLNRLRGSYRGEMDPSRGKCVRCRFRVACPGARSVGL